MKKVITLFIFKLADAGVLTENLMRRFLRFIIRICLKREERIYKDTKNLTLSQLLIEQEETPVFSSLLKEKEKEFVELKEFFNKVFGKDLYTGSCYWPENVDGFYQAERAMFNLICRRAALADGMDVLVIDGGWCAFALWLAEMFSNCRIEVIVRTGVREHLRRCCLKRSLENIVVLEEDFEHAAPAGKFDRIFALEIFEKAGNYKTLLKKISSWLEPRGILFVQLFCHWRYPFSFGSRNSESWLGRYFLRGWLIPSEDLLFHFQESLVLRRHWRLNGRHPFRTANIWLDNMRGRKKEIKSVLSEFYGGRNSFLYYWRWRFFFLICSELFSYNNGEEWYVSQFIFEHNKNQTG